MTTRGRIRTLAVGRRFASPDGPELIGRLRESDRFEIVAEPDADGALAALDAGFDCVVSDHEPPALDGLSLLRAVRERFPALPFVLHTDAGSERLASDAVAAGVSEYVPRDGDGDAAAVVARIEQAVDRRRADERRRDRARALEAASEGIGILDADGNYTDMNRAYAELYGYEPAELIGGHWARLYPDDEVARFREEILPLLADRGTWTGQSVGRRRDGSPVPEALSLSRMDGGGHVCVVHDLTEQRDREETLADLYDATRRLIAAEDPQSVCDITVQTASRVLDMGLSGVWLLDERDDVLRMRSCTNAADEFFEGEPPEYEPGNSLTWEVFESGKLRAFDDLGNTPGRYNEATQIRSEIIVPLGSHGAMNIGSRELNDFDGTDVYFVRLLAATAEAALSRAKRDELVRKRERAVSGLHDATRRLMRAETREEIAEIGVEAAKETLGFPLTTVRFYDRDRDALVPCAATDEMTETAPFAREPHRDGRKTWEAYWTREPRLFDDVREVTDADGIGDLRSLMILPLGDEGTISSGSPVVGDFDELDLDLASILAANMQSALERARRERRLTESERKLASQNEQLEEFASIVTHDLRNPLNVAQGRLDLLVGTGDEEHIPPIERAHERMGHIIEDVLLLSRRGEVIQDTRPVGLRAVAENAWATVRTEGATLDVADDREFDADEGRLQQLFENLLHNAVEHSRRKSETSAIPESRRGSEDATGPRSPRGGTDENAVEHVGSDVHVTVGTLDDGFYVEDDGPGIPADHRDRVFESGYTNTGDGTGLGLAIVSRIVDAHGWDVRVTEAGNGGARFEITGVGSTDDR